jgi:hypothetical protein
VKERRTRASERTKGKVTERRPPATTQMKKGEKKRKSRRRRKEWGHGLWPET